MFGWDLGECSLKIAYPIIFGICEDQKVLLLQKQTEETGIEFQEEVWTSRVSGVDYNAGHLGGGVLNDQRDEVVRKLENFLPDVCTD